MSGRTTDSVTHVERLKTKNLMSHRAKADQDEDDDCRANHFWRMIFSRIKLKDEQQGRRGRRKAGIRVYICMCMSVSVCVCVYVCE